MKEMILGSEYLNGVAAGGILFGVISIFPIYFHPLGSEVSPNLHWYFSSSFQGSRISLE